MSQYIHVIEKHLHELQPIPTGVPPKLQKVEDIKAVVFDVYGTLFISGSGDIGLTKIEQQSQALEGALQEMEFDHKMPINGIVELLPKVIQADHARKRVDGIPYPEVVITDIWKQVFAVLGIADSGFSDEWFQKFAIEFEMRINPAWEMPGALEVLQTLKQDGFALGIVSNAQFFTKLLFPACLESTLEEIGFEENLLVFSYEHQIAKPGMELYEMMKVRLAESQIAPRQVLYVGNDMLNDITPASKLGFRTALFAGDQRSLRWREDDERVQGVIPDLIITELSQILSCLEQHSS